MRKFFSRDDFSDLESELRDSRPAPRADLLDELVSRVERTPANVPIRRRPRVAAALVFAVVVVVALAAFGGVGYATSSFAQAAKSSTHAVTSVVKQGNKSSTNSNSSKGKSGDDNNQNNNGNNNNGNAGNGNQNGHHHGEDNDDEDHDPPWMHQYSRFVLICYPFTITFHGHQITVYRTIIVPRLFKDFFIPPGTLGACRLGPA